MPSFNTALSGLTANGIAIDVVGNNLANMNTTAYKASSTAFRDLVGDTLAGPTAANGEGVSSPLAIRRFTQGAVQATQGSMDAAISGNGFFLVKSDQGQQLLTRAGSFRVDTAGNMLTLSGEKVQGWSSVNGVVNTSGAASNLVLPAAGTRTPLATTSFSLNANLDATAATGATSLFSTPVEVVDSLGATHILTAEFTKTGANAWSYDVKIPGADVGSPAGSLVSVGTGTLTFNAQGQMTAPAAPGVVTLTVPTLANGAAPLAMGFSLYGTDGTSRLTQYAQASATSAVDQNGAQSAELVKLSIGDGGKVVGEYSNGRQATVGQLAVATLRNPESLAAAGNNNYRLTQDSSALAVGTANTGGRGNIVGQSLEGSTVDIAREFTNLIVYQRGYQANSKVISAVDELTQSVINLVR
jgi:flagellar hook protein FlgE